MHRGRERGGIERREREGEGEVERDKQILAAGKQERKKKTRQK